MLRKGIIVSDNPIHNGKAFLTRTSIRFRTKPNINIYMRIPNILA